MTRAGDNAVGKEYPEILADGSIAEQILTGGGSHDEQQMEQNTAQQCLAVGGLPNGSAANPGWLHPAYRPTCSWAP